MTRRARIGWEQTLINSALIALAFVAAGEVLVWLDRSLGGKARP